MLALNKSIKYENTNCIKKQTSVWSIMEYQKNWRKKTYETFEQNSYVLCQIWAFLMFFTHLFLFFPVYAAHRGNSTTNQYFSRIVAFALSPSQVKTRQSSFHFSGRKHENCNFSDCRQSGELLCFASACGGNKNSRNLNCFCR